MTALGVQSQLPQPSCVGIADAEARFYGQYDWCINPLRSVRELIPLLQEEIDRVRNTQLHWQKKESLTNIYLFACGVSATVADCLAPDIADVRKVAHKFGKFGGVIRHAHNVLQLAHRLHNRTHHRDVASWLHKWNKCVDLACALLLSGADDEPDLTQLDASLKHLLLLRLPLPVLDARMQLPFAFREQDFTPHEVLELAHAFSASHVRSPEPLVVVGLRTAGGYFAPLLSQQLRRLQWNVMDWVSIRPKKGLSAWESLSLRSAKLHNARVLITDDHPDTGETLRLTLQLLDTHGIATSKVTILVPSHPAQKDPSALRGGRPDIDLVTTVADRSFKHRFLEPREIEPILREYYEHFGWDEVRVSSDPTEFNGRTEDQSSNFHVRLKRVFEVCLTKAGCTPVVRRVIAKDVGCGWLGYHAYIAGTRLEPFVPRVLGLREGILFSEWIDTTRADCDRPPVSTIASYIGTRTKALPLTEDPGFTNWNQGNTLWYTLVTTLRGVYGPYVGRAKVRQLHRFLERYIPPVPAFIDANLRLQEWVRGSGDWFKLDYEHHGFGNPGLNVVDPAYDLASAIFEMGMSQQEEEELVSAYVQITRDDAVGERLILHKIVCGRTAQDSSRYHMTRSRSRDEKLAWHARYLAASDFLTFELNKFCGQSTRSEGVPCWTDKAFILDLDGVFDTPLLRFPHTTHAGLRALNWLRSNGYSVVVDTGRSARHAREYCAAYGLAGAVAEHGAVYLDGISGRQTSMISSEEAHELQVVRQRIIDDPALILDPTYECAIRVSNYESGRAAGLTNDRARRLLDGCSRLRFIVTGVDAYILPATCNKGTGWTALQAHSPSKPRLAAAIGDSDPDVDILRLADYSYAPKNCSFGIRKLAADGRCRIMRRPFQSGLLLAVSDLMKRTGGNPEGSNRKNRLMPPDHILTLLLKAADEGRMHKIVSAAKWWSL